MHFKQDTIVLIALTFVVATAAKYPGIFKPDTELGPLHFAEHSNYLMQRNPTRSLECFDQYSKEYQVAMDKYQTNYNTCCENADNDRSNVEVATLNQRNDLANRTLTVCAMLSECSKDKSVNDEYECYIDGGSTSAGISYGISSDAINQLADLVENYRLITFNQDKCANETKRVYEDECVTAYSKFSLCLSGREAPTPATTTELPPNPTTTTEATTEDPTTLDPITIETTSTPEEPMNIPSFKKIMKN